MKVTLRERPLECGLLCSLRLDIYPPVPHPDTGKLTRFHKLGMFLHINPKTSEARVENKRIKALANTIRAKIEL